MGMGLVSHHGKQNGDMRPIFGASSPQAAHMAREKSPPLGAQQPYRPVASWKLNNAALKMVQTAKNSVLSSPGSWINLDRYFRAVLHNRNVLRNGLISRRIETILSIVCATDRRIKKSKSERKFVGKFPQSLESPERADNFAFSLGQWQLRFALARRSSKWLTASHFPVAKFHWKFPV
jgi:hypothetical protein